MRAYLGLGSNLGDRLGHLRLALTRIGALSDTRIASVSSVYESAPLNAPPPDFLNAVCRIETTLAPDDLLSELQRIEAEGGRARQEPNAPRTIDLDLLLFHDLVLATERLCLPHPRMSQRAFVMVPLLELDADVVDPRTGTPFAQVPVARISLRRLSVTLNSML